MISPLQSLRKPVSPWMRSSLPSRSTTTHPTLPQIPPFFFFLFFFFFHSRCLPSITRPLFAPAGLKFKLAKDHANAVQSYRRAAECHAHHKCSSTPFHAGKALETAAQCARTMGDINNSISLIKEAAHQYRLTGKNQSACSALEKAGACVCMCVGTCVCVLVRVCMCVCAREKRE